MSDLEKLAYLIRKRNQTASEIAELIERPAQIGHIGEFIAAHVFGISLMDSASNKALDGHFDSGGLQGSSVNIKWYAKNDGLLAITPDSLPDYYLVLTGARTGAESSSFARIIRATHKVDRIGIGRRPTVDSMSRQCFVSSTDQSHGNR